MENKKFIIIQLICWVVVLILIIGVCVYMFNGKINLFGNKNDTPIQLNQSFASNMVNEKIDINLVSEDVVIKQGDVEDITVNYKSNDSDAQNYIVIECENGVLKVYRKVNISFKWFSHINASLTVTVPKNFDTDYKINTTSGKITVNDITVTSMLDISAVSGDIEVADTLVKDDLNCSSTSGEINVKLADNIEKVKISTTSGECNITANAKKIQVGSTSGSVEVEGKSDDVKISTVSGEIDVNCQNQPEKLDIGSTSGTVKITLPQNITGFKLKRSTTSGITKEEFSNNSFDKGGNITYGDGKVNIDVSTVSGSLKIYKA